MKDLFLLEAFKYQRYRVDIGDFRQWKIKRILEKAQTLSYGEKIGRF